MASKAVKISVEFVEEARVEGGVMHRSTGAQIEYWARIGQQVEATGVLDRTDVRRLLEGQGSVQDLTEEGDAAYLESLTEKLEGIDGSDQRVLDELRAGGHAVASTDRDGKLVIERADDRAGS